MKPDIDIGMQNTINALSAIIKTNTTYGSKDLNWYKAFYKSDPFIKIKHYFANHEKFNNLYYYLEDSEDEIRSLEHKLSARLNEIESSRLSALIKREYSIDNGLINIDDETHVTMYGPSDLLVESNIDKVNSMGRRICGKSWVEVKERVYSEIAQDGIKPLPMDQFANEGIKVDKLRISNMYIKPMISSPKTINDITTVFLILSYSQLNINTSVTAFANQTLDQNFELNFYKGFQGDLSDLNLLSSHHSANTHRFLTIKMWNAFVLVNNYSFPLCEYIDYTSASNIYVFEPI